MGANLGILPIVTQLVIFVALVGGQLIIVFTDVILPKRIVAGIGTILAMGYCAILWGVTSDAAPGTLGTLSLMGLYLFVLALLYHIDAKSDLTTGMMAASCLVLTVPWAKFRSWELVYWQRLVVAVAVVMAVGCLSASLFQWLDRRQHARRTMHY